ncbi:MAG: hypothetical protein WA215_14185 [Candidatus Cybelea sp.]
MVRKAVWALAFALVPSVALASPPPPSQIVALVKATPQLKIDRGVPPSSAFDPKSHPYVDVLGAPEGQAIGGYVISELAHQGTLTSGYDVLAVPLDSGGSGGVFTEIVFARRGHVSFAYVGHIDSAGHLAVQVRGGKLVATLPYYAAKDPNCCPSKFIVATYSIRDGKLRRTTQRMIPTPRPSP